MSTKYVRDTKAAGQISAYVILRADGTEVATVNAYFGASGSVLVNIFNYGANNPDAEHKGFQYARASGYGYDKFTAALGGLSVDGHALADHACVRLDPPAGGVWPKDATPALGHKFANYNTEKGGYTSCFQIEGLDYLRAFGYRVIQAI